MPLYNIYAGLNGGFGGANYIETTECENITVAEELAYWKACEEYDDMGGLHGLFNREEALEENPDLSEEDLEEMENEDRENWIDYYAILKEEDPNDISCD